MDKEKGVLKLIPLGGMGEVTKNIYVYEYKDDILVVDCGIGFPEGDLLGVDVIIPDVGYLQRKVKNIRAFLITHGHNDHFSALPYVLPQLEPQIPIYATKLVSAFVKLALKEFGLLEVARVKEFDPDAGAFDVGCFRISPFRVNHSVPDSVGFVIDTPEGRVVHVSDFKFDLTPMDGRVFEIQKLCRLTEGGADLLLSDCLGSHKEGFTRSEKDIEKAFDDLLEEASGQVFVTATSSNVSRIQQAINSSVRHKRKVVLLGRSVRENITTAIALGYVRVPKGALIEAQKARGMPEARLTYIVAGSYGQKGSALSRIAEGEAREVRIKKGAMVIFSSDPAPSGVKDAVDKVVDKLTRLGADVHYYEIQENLHVSGHGSQGDILLLARIVRPTYFVPIGGTAGQMRGYTKLMERAGVPSQNVFELRNGEVLELRQGRARRGRRVRLADVFVDGLGVGDVGRKVLEERSTLSESGVLVVAVPVSEDLTKVVGKIEVSSRGFVFEKEAAELLSKVRKMSAEFLAARLGKTKTTKVRRELETKISRYLFSKTQREPIVLITFVRV